MKWPPFPLRPARVQPTVQSVGSPLLDVMNEGLAGLEVHPLLTEASCLTGLTRFERHALAFADGLERLLERRVAMDLDPRLPGLGGFGRRHLRVHQPLPRALRTHLTSLGEAREDLDQLRSGPRTRRCLTRVAGALGRDDPIAAHVLLTQGLECLTQLLAKRGSELTQALDGPEDNCFERRHHGHEPLLFEGLKLIEGQNPAAVDALAAELEMLFADGIGVLDEWRDEDPPSPPRGRTRRRGSQWGTSDLPTGAA